MTFSIGGICEKTGQVGCAVATSSMAVGARVGRVLERRGVVFSQARTDPRLHQVGLAALQVGASADSVLDHMVAAATQPQWRQLGVVTSQGGVAHHTGASCLPYAGGLAGNHCLALGNFLAGESVVGAMASRFEETLSSPLADRLVSALQAGQHAGGELDPLRSASLLVFSKESFAWADLRCDDDAEPITRVSDLWDEFRDKADAYAQRALDPGNAPDSRDIER